MGKKAGGGFMITRNNILRNFLFLAFIVILSCDTDRVDDPIPFQPFADIVVITTNYPELGDGKSITIDGGVRGIIIHRKSSTQYLAFERNCSFQPNDACATVDIHATTQFMFDACCGSSFRFDDGNPTGGPAWRPLRQYETSLNVNVLTITDEILD